VQHLADHAALQSPMIARVYDQIGRERDAKSQSLDAPRDFRILVRG
jgi:hypothetical protein